jgi:hypothetical protein
LKVRIRLVANEMSEKIDEFMDEIKSCLQVITNPKEAKPGEFRETLARLDILLVQEKENIHPRLRHFLEKRSYLKAVTWIEGGSPEKGICGQ